MEKKIINFIILVILILFLIFIGILISDSLAIHQLLNELEEINTKLFQQLENLEIIEKKKLADLENTANQQIKILEENQKVIKKSIDPDPHPTLEWILLISIFTIGLYVVKTVSFGK